jgi:hypothetical protein
MFLCFSGAEPPCLSQYKRFGYFIYLFVYRYILSLSFFRLCLLQYLGVWNEIYHYPAKHQERYTCFIDDYKKTPSGGFNLTSSVYDKTWVKPCKWQFQFLILPFHLCLDRLTCISLALFQQLSVYSVFSSPVVIYQSQPPWLNCTIILNIALCNYLRFPATFSLSFRCTHSSRRFVFKRPHLVFFLRVKNCVV